MLCQLLLQLHHADFTPPPPDLLHSSGACFTPSVALVQDHVDRPEFLMALQNSALFLSREEKTEVGVVDMNAVEWWTLVDPIEPQESFCKTPVPTECKAEKEDDLNGSYVFVQHEDVVDAMAQLIGVTIAKMPEARGACLGVASAPCMWSFAFMACLSRAEPAELNRYITLSSLVCTPLHTHTYLTTIGSLSAKKLMSVSEL